MQFIKKDHPATIRAWTFYDWANSVFPLVITSAIFPNFYDYVTTHDAARVFTGHTVNCFGRSFENQNIYTFVYAFALSLVVVMTPLLSGIADYLGNKKRFLQFFCYLGGFSCMGLFFFDRQHLELSFIPFITATVGFWGSLVYYNAYLPEIASPENQDKVSARGFSMGYLGSSILLIICLIGILVFKKNDLTGTGFFRVEYSFLLTGLWWIGFAQYTFKHLPAANHAAPKQEKSKLILNGFRELLSVFKRIRKMQSLKRFLSSYFFYNMGVQTVMVVAVLFARNEIDWGTGEEAEKAKTSSLIISILLIQFIGILGAFVFSRLSKRIGNLPAILLAIGLWIFICVFTYSSVYLPYQFYFVATLVGFVMGGVQTLSRSTYSKYLPDSEDTTSFFSFYDVVEKLGMIIGTVSFGLISQALGGMRESILSLILFFIAGFVGLLFVPNLKPTR